MTSPFHVALGGAAASLLGACDPTGPVDPAANLTANAVSTSDEASIAPIEPRSQNDQARASGAANQEPIVNPKPDPAPSSAPTKSPAPAPRRVILPSPIQPPAEIDPVLPDPGDEVPR